MKEGTTTAEHERRIRTNIALADALVGAIEAVNVAIKAEGDPGYRKYLDTAVREFLEEEHRQAEAAHSAYLEEIAYLTKEVGLNEEEAALRLRDDDLWILHPYQRFDEDLQGEEGVRAFEEAATIARVVGNIVSNGPDTLQANPAITQLVWDVDARAQEALRRAQQRQDERPEDRAGARLVMYSGPLGGHPELWEAVSTVPESRGPEADHDVAGGGDVLRPSLQSA